VRSQRYFDQPIKKRSRLFRDCGARIRKADALFRTLELSHPSELLLRLRWTALLYGKVKASLGVTGGVHSASDALKATLAGADVMQVVSALLAHGPEQLDRIRLVTETWLRQNRLDSLSDLRGRLSLERAPNPKAYERMNYIYNLDSWYGHVSAPVESGRRV